MKNLPRGLELLGAVITTLAAFWWLLFYADKGMQNYLICFIYTTGPCAFLNVAAEFSGNLGFYPIVSWIGIGCLLAGAILQRREAGDVIIERED